MQTHLEIGASVEGKSFGNHKNNSYCIFDHDAGDMRSCRDGRGG